MPRRRLFRAALAVALCGVLLVPPTSVIADSGGYRRPSVSQPSASTWSSPRNTSPTSGYRRPSSVGGYATGSAGDLSLSRANSAQTLQQYRASQAQRRPPVMATMGNEPRWGGDAWRRPPASAAPSGSLGRNFGSAAFWAALGALSAADRNAYFRDYQSDPAYQQWHQQALRDPNTSARLAALGDHSALATGAAAASATTKGSGGLLWIIIFVAVVAFVLLWLARRRTAMRAITANRPGLSGSTLTRFRVGQTIPLDPTPFLLAGQATKVKPPPAGEMVSVEVVGLLEDAGVQLHRLYLPGGTNYFQLHLGPDGNPDECRYFSRLDEVQPASAAEWGEWLDPAQGMIGWPAFETKDGKTYGRAWAPGNTRIPPRQQIETVQTPDTAIQRRLQVMLYAGPTEARPPAPQYEFILVAAVEQSSRAWVEIHAGIDVNPAALSLPYVPL
jgi:hypothetical protein